MLRTTACLACLLVASPALASPDPDIRACLPRAAMLAQLADCCGERPEGWRLVNGTVLEFLMSPAGTWTVTGRRPRDLACIIGSGHGAKRPVPAVREVGA